MGVLACDRYRCGNIMCDRYSPKYGYICDECYTELRAMVQSIDYFVKTPKDENQNEGLDQHQNLVDEVFPDYDTRAYKED